MSKSMFKNIKWIWCNSSPKADEYGEFVDHFYYEGGKTVLFISADSNYAAYINGELIAWGQYADFPYDKVYDEIDVTEYCKKGENRIAILVWYYGLDTSSVYYPGNASLMYQLTCNGSNLCRSNKDTLSRMSKAYTNHHCHIISYQLGYSYKYDATKEDDWLLGELVDFSSSVEVEQTPPLRKRPCNKLVLYPEKTAIVCKEFSDTNIIYDLESEQVGFLSFDFLSSHEQDVTIAYGEHINDGCVRQKIGPRDFSITYRAKKGENKFLNPFRRLGCRYLEIHSSYPLSIKKIAIVPTMYIVKEKERPSLTEEQNKIYDACIETLRLCMHEHYEDCPWREQALYTMDSRNQMLCGYYAFGEFTFPRSNLELISKDNRPDNLLSICFPMKMDYTIPSFTLHYITQCLEYMLHSKDYEFMQQIYPKLVLIIDAFSQRLVDGILFPFEGSNYWNFYEWTEHHSGYNTNLSSPDLLINCLFSIALQNMGIISDALKIANDYREQAHALNKHIYATFYDSDMGIFRDFWNETSYSQLGNALAICCGCITGQKAEALCDSLMNNSKLEKCSLSMRCFVYDAWLKINKEKYSSYILKEIDETYSTMLETGSTTVWETILGEKDFDNAGSLCHGWSAMPIYYYHILQK